MIPITGQHAIRAAVFLARHENSAKTAACIACETGIPGHYLAKILQQLGRVRIVRGQRGVRGGYILALPATLLTVLDVLRAVECAPHRACKGAPDDSVVGPPCALQQMFNQIDDLALRVLSSTTLSELAAPVGTWQISMVEPKPTENAPGA